MMGGHYVSLGIKDKPRADRPLPVADFNYRLPDFLINFAGIYQGGGKCGSHVSYLVFQNIKLAGSFTHLAF